MMDFNRFQAQIESHPSDGGCDLPPVEQWHPPFCGNIDMCITASGEWQYQQSPVTRLSLVRLFSSVLVKENDDYFLVTPVEKVGIQVEDVPFVIIQWAMEDNHLRLTTQTGDTFTVSASHPGTLRASLDGTFLPYVNVRRNLWARLHQNVYYQLLNEAEEKTAPDGTTRFTVQSGDYELILGEISE